jgi:hypothetical protein
MVVFVYELNDGPNETTEWREADPKALTGIAVDHDLRTHTYPGKRLMHEGGSA